MPNYLRDLAEKEDRERLSVIRVVGALMFYSIEWGPGGERKVPVSLSITELSRLTRLSRQHVHEAVQEAQARGYIVQMDSGCFDPAAGQGSRAATYAVRWAGGAPAIHSVTGPTGAVAAAGKGDQSKKVNGEEYKKMNGISIKTDLKTLEATATAPGAHDDPLAAAVEALMKAGFDTATAQRLARKRTLEIIQRQIEWLPLRNSSRNRLGLLCRAIEQDWPRPESAATTER